MDVKTLQYFIAVVESTNITKAAKALHMSQPPLSQQLKLLEEELGTQLLVRGARSVTLTSAGEALYHRAKNIVDFMEETSHEIKSIGSGRGGHIKIGLISSLAPGLISKIMNVFCSEYPGVKFDIYERNTYELLDSLENNLIEIAFVRTPFDAGEDYRKVLLAKERLVAFGDAAYFDGIDAEALEPEFFHQKPIFIYRRWQNILKSYFKEKGVSPIYRCTNDDAKSSLLLALSGQGIAVVPENITALMEKESMRYVPIHDPALETEVYATWNPNRYISPATENFIQMLEKL